VQTSHPEALLYAMRAFYNYWLAYGPDGVGNFCYYFVDFGLGRNQRRGYLIDMRGLRLLEGGPFTVAHGNGSGKVEVPHTFRNGHYATSLGLYVSHNNVGPGLHEGHYKSGDKSLPYTSNRLFLDGLSGRFNSRAATRGAYLHAAPYVKPESAGFSEGCPAIEMSRQQSVISRLAGRALAFLFSPNDPDWMSADPWVHYRGYPTCDARQSPPRPPHIHLEGVPQMHNIA
jgi:hypothetical protein